MQTKYEDIIPTTFFKDVLREVWSFTLGATAVDECTHENWKEKLELYYDHPLVKQSKEFLERASGSGMVFERMTGISKRRCLAISNSHPCVAMYELHLPSILDALQSTQTCHACTLCLYGCYAEIARPTVLITCPNPERLEGFTYLPGIDILLNKGTVVQQARRLAGDRNSYEKVPMGACIGAKGEDAVSFGGYLVDEESNYYGLTAEHFIPAMVGKLEVFQPPNSENLFGTVVHSNPSVFMDWALIKVAPGENVTDYPNMYDWEWDKGVHGTKPISEMMHVTKCGFATGMTDGIISGVQAHVHFKDRTQSCVSWPVFSRWNYPQSFSREGDSGAWVVDEDCDLVGCVAGGTNGTTDFFVTFINSIEEVLSDITLRTDLVLKLPPKVPKSYPADAKKPGTWMKELLREALEITLADFQGLGNVTYLNWRETLPVIGKTAKTIEMRYRMKCALRFLNDLEIGKVLTDSHFPIPSRRPFAVESDYPSLLALDRARDRIADVMRETQTDYSVTCCKYGRYRDLAIPCIYVVCADPENILLKRIPHMENVHVEIEKGTTKLFMRGGDNDLKYYDVVPPGVSIGVKINGEVKSGTFGGYLYAGKKCYGISCGHVLGGKDVSALIDHNVYQPTFSFAMRDCIATPAATYFGRLHTSKGPVVKYDALCGRRCMDWALFEVDEQRKCKNTLTPWSRGHDNYGGSIENLGKLTLGAPVLKCGFATGVTIGQLAQSIVKFKEVEEESREWCTFSGSNKAFARRGDSGAWVTDEHCGLIGYVIGGSQDMMRRTQVTHISEMSAVLRDIEESIGLDLRLYV